MMDRREFLAAFAAALPGAQILAAAVKQEAVAETEPFEWTPPKEAVDLVVYIAAEVKPGEAAELSISIPDDTGLGILAGLYILGPESRKFEMQFALSTYMSFMPDVLRLKIECSHPRIAAYGISARPVLLMNDWEKTRVEYGPTQKIA